MLDDFAFSTRQWMNTKKTNLLARDSTLRKLLQKVAYRGVNLEVLKAAKQLGASLTYGACHFVGTTTQRLQKNAQLW